MPDRVGEGEIVSRWTESSDSIHIEVEAGALAAHDMAIELLLCVGQALWEQISSAEEAAWLQLLRDEIDAEVSGEIDEDALAHKRRLLSDHASARSTRLLQRYARAAFAGTVAEYVHCLWHDVTVRIGPEHLPATRMRLRLEWLARCFPPDRGYRVFPRE